MQLQLLQNNTAKYCNQLGSSIKTQTKKHLSYLTSIKMQVFIQTDYADQSFKNKNWPEISRKTNFERPHYTPLAKCIYLGLRNHIFHHPACFQGPCSNKDH